MNGAYSGWSEMASTIAVTKTTTTKSKQISEWNSEIFCPRVHAACLLRLSYIFCSYLKWLYHSYPQPKHKSLLADYHMSNNLLWCRYKQLNLAFSMYAKKKRRNYDDIYMFYASGVSMTCSFTSTLWNLWIINNSEVTKSQIKLFSREEVCSWRK